MLNLPQNTAGQAEWTKRKAELFVPWMLHCICPYTLGLQFRGYISRNLMTGPWCEKIYCLCPLIFWKFGTWSFHSDLSSAFRDSQTTFMFKLLGKYFSVIAIYFWKWYCQIELLMLSKGLLWVLHHLWYITTCSFVVYLEMNGNIAFCFRNYIDTSNTLM